MAAATAARTAFRAVPGPPPLPLIGNTVGFVRGLVEGLKQNKPYDFLRTWHQQYGPVVRMQMAGIGNCIMLSDPDHIKWLCRNDPARFTKGESYESIKRGWLDGTLVVSEGEAWRIKRELYAKAFRLGAIRSYAPLFSAIAQDVADAWRLTHDRGEDVDAVKTFEEVAMEAIGQAGFGMQGLGAPGNLYASAFVEYTRVVNQEMNAPIMQLLPQTMRAWVTKQRGAKSFADMQAESRRIIAEATSNARREAEGARRSLVAMMQEACAEEGAEDMDPEQLAREANLWLFAGHDTTSATLAWTWAMLGSHPEVQERLFDEVSRVPCEALVSELSDPRALPYLGAVLKETLRLYGPAPMVVRKSKFDEDVGGHRIPAGTNYMPSMWCVQRNPEVFDEPDDFRPERWNEENPEKIKRMQDHWMPFMLGARGCIGQHFSLMETRVVVATLLKQFSVELVSKPQIVSKIILIPSNISLRCTPR